MKKCFHNLKSYAFALIALVTMGACHCALNTLQDPRFSEDGKLVGKQSFAKLDYVSTIHFCVESSGSMNGFFRGGQPTEFKQDVYEIMSYYAPQTEEIDIMSNDGGVTEQMALPQFQTAMNTGALLSNASTKIPIMLKSIVGRMKKEDVAVLISDMKYSPVGDAAPQVLLTQYAAEIAAISGKSKKAYSLVCAISDYVDRNGNIVTNESPYYYLIIGDQDKVSAIRNGIASLLQRQKRFVDNLEIGYKYASCPYSFGIPKNAVQLDKQPTFYGYDESMGDCAISLKLHLEAYRWLMSNKDVLKENFTCKALYGSKVEVADIKIEECNNVGQKLERSVTATVQLKVSNMMADMDVLEWNVNIPYAEKTPMIKFMDGALEENDVTKSYSLENFIRGIAQGGVVNYQPKPNYILISKNNI